MRSLETVNAARAAVDEGFEQLSDSMHRSILRELVRAVFGTLEEPGLAAEVRSLKRWGIGMGSVGLGLQIVAAFNLSDTLKHVVIALLGGHA